MEETLKIMSFPAPALTRDRAGWSHKFLVICVPNPALTSAGFVWVSLGYAKEKVSSSTLLTDGNIAGYFNGDRAHKFQPAASSFSPQSGCGLMGGCPEMHFLLSQRILEHSSLLFVLLHRP